MGLAELDQPAVSRLQFRRAPLAAAALWFAGGVGLARWSDPPTGLLVAGLVALALICGIALWLGERGRRVAWMPVAGLWVAVGLAAAVWEPGPPVQAELVACADGLSRGVEGEVVRVRTLEDAAVDTRYTSETPEWAEDRAEDGARPAVKALVVDVAVRAVEVISPDEARMQPMQGGVRLYVYPAADGRLPVLGCGDAVRMQARLRLPERYLDPGAWQYGDYLLAQGIAAQGTAKAARVHVVGVVAGWSRGQAMCRVRAAQAWAAGRMERFVGSRANRMLPMAARLSGADAAMLDAMLFGDRAGLNHALRVGFERTGSFHLFVVSGLHVALLAGTVFWGLRRLRVPVWAATVVTLMVATAYAVLTGFGQPVQRALAMTALFLVAKLLWRETETLNALGAAALGMLVWAPSSLWEASFQMTVLALVAIAGIAVPLGERTVLRYAHAAKDVFGPQTRLAPGAAQLRVMLQIWGEACGALLGPWAREMPANAVRLAMAAGELALVGTVAELVMVLPMAMYFHRAAVFALPANMVVIPVIAVVAPLGVVTFVAAVVSPWLAAVPAAATGLLLHGVEWVIGRLSGLAVADVRVPGPAAWVALVACFVWLACVWAVRRGRWGAWAAVALPVVAAMVLWPRPMERVAGVLEVTAVDVGQGDSLFLVGPNGGTMLVDAGGPVGRAGQQAVNSGAGGGLDVGEEVVSPYLWTRQVRRLDVVVLTHAHSDHMGGMPAVLRNFRPRELWVGVDSESEGFRALLVEARELGIRVRRFRAGDRTGWDGTEVTVLSPAVGYWNAGPPKNDDSLVMRVEFGRASVLLEGDAERHSEQTMLADGRVEPVTLLKVGHHGSLTSTSEALVEAARPRDAVVSVGRGNPFGHPRGEVVERLAEAGVHLYRTDEFGLTRFLLRPDGTVTEQVVGLGGR